MNKLTAIMHTKLVCSIIHRKYLTPIMWNGRATTSKYCAKCEKNSPMGKLLSVAEGMAVANKKRKELLKKARKTKDPVEKATLTKMATACPYRDLP